MKDFKNRWETTQVSNARGILKHQSSQIEEIIPSLSQKWWNHHTTRHHAAGKSKKKSYDQSDRHKKSL